MRQPNFVVLSLLFFSPLVTATPHGQISQSPCHQHSPRPWRRLTDAIIRKVWGLPDKETALSAPTADSTITFGSPSRKLIARYGEDIVLRFNITSAEEAAALAEASDTLFLDVWEFNDNWCDIRAAKDVVPSLLGLLPPSLQNSHVALMQDLDLAQAIFDSYPTPSSTQSHDDDRSFTPNLQTQSRTENIFFQDYQPLSVINPWMNLMASMFSSHVRKINVGISYEGRDIPGLRVGVHPTNDGEPSKPRRTVLITGGSHAREWVSVSTVNYVAWSLITSYGRSSLITHLLEKYDFVLVPTLNPDGYVYSWETDRLWRKNRQPTSLRFCRGVDLDRSYSFEWDGESARANPCSEAYAGTTPFEGVEAKRFADWAKNETENNNVEFVGFLDLHSYSQQVLYPYSYSCATQPPTLEDLEEVALGLAKAIRMSRRGHFYKVTSACEGNVAMSKSSVDKKDQVRLPRIESSGGSALDWFYHELKLRYAYQIKLRDTGSYGFLLPKESIVPTGKEMLEAVLYFGKYLLGEVGMTEEEEGDAHSPQNAKTVKEWNAHNEKGMKAADEGEEEEPFESSLELRRRRKR